MATTESTHTLHSIRAEEALLGVMMLTPDATAVGFEIIKSKDYFFKPSHQKIFKAMQAIYEKGGNIDYLIVAEYLANENTSKNSIDQNSIDDATNIVIEEADLYRMRSDAPSSAHAEDYAKIVRDNFMRRSLQGAAEEAIDLISQSPDKPVGELIDEVEGLIYSATNERLSFSTRPFPELSDHFIKELEKLYENGSKLTGRATGYRRLDYLLNGLQRQNLIIIGARPAHGKTSFALGAACNIAKSQPVLFFSMEMSAHEITRRIASQQSLVRNEVLQTGKLNSQEWQQLPERLGHFGANSQLHIDDNPALTVLEVRAKARRLKAELGELGAVFVDYLQLMTPTPSKKQENRQNEVSEISRGLKILARELDCPVVVMSQLSRSIENRGDKQPHLADLRESGSIEQDADVVIFLYRENAYNNRSNTTDTTNITVAKHRSGATDRFPMGWNGSYTLFENLPDAEAPAEAQYAVDEELI